MTLYLMDCFFPARFRLTVAWLSTMTCTPLPCSRISSSNTWRKQHKTKHSLIQIGTKHRTVTFNQTQILRIDYLKLSGLSSTNYSLLCRPQPRTPLSGWSTPRCPTPYVRWLVFEAFPCWPRHHLSSKWKVQYKLKARKRNKLTLFKDEFRTVTVISWLNNNGRDDLTMSNVVCWNTAQEIVIHNWQTHQKCCTVILDYYPPCTVKSTHSFCNIISTLLLL